MPLRRKAWYAVEAIIILSIALCCSLFGFRVHALSFWEGTVSSDFSAAAVVFSIRFFTDSPFSGVRAFSNSFCIRVSDTPS